MVLQDHPLHPGNSLVPESQERIKIFDQPSMGKFLNLLLATTTNQPTNQELKIERGVGLRTESWNGDGDRDQD